MATLPIQLKLSANVRSKPERDELYKDEISTQQQIIKERKLALQKEEIELRKLFSLQAKANGLEPAYMEVNDLIKIIEDILLTGSPISKAFNKHELNGSKCKRWADRTIKQAIDKNDLTQAIDYLCKNKGNTSLSLISQYNLLDTKNILKSASYREALNKMKKQLAIAQKLKDKDDQLALKDLTIFQKDREVDKLITELNRDKSTDWKSRAIDLKKSGVSVADIAKRLGKGRTTISNHLNSPKVKIELPT